MAKSPSLLSLREWFEKGQVITDPAELLVYERDATLERGLPDAVVFLRTVADVIRAVRWAAENGVPVVARGAGTGLSGGAVAEYGGIILEFSQMGKVLELDRVGRSVVVEPGVVNLTLDGLVKAAGLYYPPDPASGRAATLGGNVAENAGGPHCFKYGVTSNYLTGLEIVLADGRAVMLGGRAYDYPEYDLLSLVTGSEGTLAVITKILARLVRNPPGLKTMTAAFNSVEEAGEAVSAVIAAGLVPATMEMMDQNIMRAVEDYVHVGLPVHAGAMLIMEVDGYAAGLDPQMEEVRQILAGRGGLYLRVAQDSAERDKLWYGRKSAAGAMARLAPAYLLVDGTVPRSRLAETLRYVDRILTRENLRVGYVFHAGDGNLHPFVLMYPSDTAQVKRVFDAAFEVMQGVVEREGSITGEHGVGIEKREYMLLMYSGAELSAMWDVKEVFDPKGCLNPGKIFPRKMPPVGRVPPASTVPAGEFAPASAKDAAAGLAALSAARQPVRITNREPLQQTGQRPTVRLATHNLAGVHTYAPDDLYITVGSGTTLAAVQEYLAREGRQVALASPWPETTVGALVATNLNAPLRLRYGAIRDQLLCTTVALADGRLIRAGRVVVKNVAGYDLPKIMVGSYGTLGLMTDITLKLMPLPRARASLFVPVSTLERGLELATRLLPVALVASGLVLARGVNSPGVPASAYLLVYSAEGMPEDVEAELGQARQALSGDGAQAHLQVVAPTATGLWAHLFGDAAAGSVLIRAGVAPKDLARYALAQQDTLESSAFLVDVPSGLVYIAMPLGERDEVARRLYELRRPAYALGGYAVVVDAPGDQQLDRWGYPSPSRALQQALKAKWDPAGILGQGMFMS